MGKNIAFLTHWRYAHVFFLYFLAPGSLFIKIRGNRTLFGATDQIIISTSIRTQKTSQNSFFLYLLILRGKTKSLRWHSRILLFSINWLFWCAFSVALHFFKIFLSSGNMNSEDNGYQRGAKTSPQLPHLMGLFWNKLASLKLLKYLNSAYSCSVARKSHVPDC